MSGSESTSDDVCVLHSRTVSAAREIVSVISTSESSSSSSSSLMGANNTGTRRRFSRSRSVVDDLACVTVLSMKNAKCPGSSYRKYSVLETDM